MARSTAPSKPARSKAPASRAVRCYHCGHAHDVAARATRVSCPKCAKSLRVEDVTIKTTEGWQHFQTCGRVVILAKGKLIAQSIEAQGGIEVRGGIETKTYRGGPVILKKSAVWRGDCAAPALAMEEGARIQNGRFTIGDHDDLSPANASHGS